MKKKIILIFSMLVLVVCLFAISASATTATYTKPEKYTSGSMGVDYLALTDVDPEYDCIIYYTSAFVYVTSVEDFVEFVNGRSYTELESYCEEKYNETGFAVYAFFFDISYEKFYDINVFNYFVNYTESSGGVSAEELEAKYQEGFTDGEQLGYTNGYSEGMQGFAEEEKNLIEQYYTQGGEFNANGLSEYISSNGSEAFKAVHTSVGTSSNYSLFEQNFSSSSSSSSHGGSTITESSKGENYGESHFGEISTDCCYNPGYIDGVADGGTVYKGSDSYQADITNEINSYMQSEEYETLMNEYSAHVVEQYLESTEYKTAIDSSFVAGRDAGEALAWEKAKDEVLADGVRQGYLNYKGSQEYRDAIDSSKTAGYIDGVEDGKNSVVDPSGVLILFAVVISLGLIIFVIYKKARSARSKKKR